MEITEMVRIYRAQLQNSTPEQIATVKNQAIKYMLDAPLVQEKRSKAAVLALQEMGIL